MFLLHQSTKSTVYLFGFPLLFLSFLYAENNWLYQPVSQLKIKIKQELCFFHGLIFE